MDTITQILDQLGINTTVFSQLVIVFILYFFSKYILFGKLQEVIEKRIEKTTKAVENANDFNAQFESLKQEYESKLDKTYKEVQEYKSQETSRVDKELEVVFKAEEKTLNEKIEIERNNIKAAIEAKRSEVISHSESLAEQLVEKIRA
jgi:F0F1-type ATP synthase membrane subunit b/b'